MKFEVRDEDVPKVIVRHSNAKEETLERHVPQMLLRGEQVAIIVKIDWKEIRFQLKSQPRSAPRIWQLLCEKFDLNPNIYFACFSTGHVQRCSNRLNICTTSRKRLCVFLIFFDNKNLFDETMKNNNSHYVVHHYFRVLFFLKIPHVTESINIHQNFFSSFNFIPNILPCT